MKCEYCGRTNRDEAELCKSCGAPTAEEDETVWYEPQGRVRLHIGLDPNKQSRRITDYTNSTHTTNSQIVMPDGRKIYILDN